MNWILKKAIFMYEDTKYIIEFDGNKRSFDPFLRGLNWTQPTKSQSRSIFSYPYIRRIWHHGMSVVVKLLPLLPGPNLSAAV